MLIDKDYFKDSTDIICSELFTQHTPGRLTSKRHKLGGGGSMRNELTTRMYFHRHRHPQSRI